MERETTILDAGTGDFHNPLSDDDDVFKFFVKHIAIMSD
jgi:hypothetical protein